jgi:hypothetical protein
MKPTVGADAELLRTFLDATVGPQKQAARRSVHRWGSMRYRAAYAELERRNKAAEIAVAEEFAGMDRQLALKCQAMDETAPERMQLAAMTKVELAAYAVHCQARKTAALTAMEVARAELDAANAEWQDADRRIATLYVALGKVDTAQPSS